MENAYAIIIITLAIVSVTTLVTSTMRDRMYQKQINDLLNRIMSRDIKEYKDVNSSTTPKARNFIKTNMDKKEFKGLYE